MFDRLPLLKDADLRGKVVLVRVDHNVVKKGEIHDSYRIDSTFPTLVNIIAKGGKLILMTHVGRPKDKKTGNIKISHDDCVEPIVKYLSEKLGLNLYVPKFPMDNDRGITSITSTVNYLLRKLQNSEIDGIYLPNTRWFYGEEGDKDDMDLFSRQLGGLADIFVNDAFGSWQAHASTVGVTKYLPAYAGYLMEKEIRSLHSIFDPERPFLAVVAGSKFDTKIKSLNALLKKADNLVLGGVLYNAYLCAKYNISIKGIGEEDIVSATKFVEFTKKYPGKLIELPYIVESDIQEAKEDGKYRVRAIRDLKAGASLNYVFDVAKESFEDEGVKTIFMNAKTIFVNAVMGFTPNFSEGTKALNKLVKQNRSARKLFGGGDTLQEMKDLTPEVYMYALDNPSYYLFTGGGAVLDAIELGSPYGMAPVKALLEGFTG